MNITTINPTTEEILEIYPVLSQQELEIKLEKADRAYSNWKTTSFAFRSELMWRLGDLLFERKEQYAKLMALEMGKPISQASGEIEKCAFVCRYYADNAEEFLKNEHIETNHSKSYISYQPQGALLAIMPWNYPFWQVFRFAAPYIMAGNVGVLKHSDNTTACAIAIEQLFLDAGFPEHIFTSLIVNVEKMESVIKNPIIKGITFTGSTRVGKLVATQAGSVMKKCVFELGGNDAYIILDDADLEAAAAMIVNARYVNSGQTCISPKRIIITKKRIKAMTDLLMKYASKWTNDDPMLDKANTMGPIARADLLKGFDAQVQASIKAGAECLLGGEKVEGKGYFYQPTLLKNITPENPAYYEEFFGPVLCTLEVENENEAITVANDTIFGLGGAVFSKDIERATRIAEFELNAGSVAINSIVKSDPRLPFGGIGDSGYGREIGVHGIREFMNVKTVCVE